jgi:hypothetical protein
MSSDNATATDAGESSSSSDSDSETTPPRLYSTVIGDDGGKPHFVDPADDRNEFDSEATEVDGPVTTLCSFEKDAAIRLDSEDEAMETLATLCDHCAASVAEDRLTTILALVEYDSVTEIEAEDEEGDE